MAANNFRAVRIAYAARHGFLGAVIDTLSDPSPATPPANLTQARRQRGSGDARPLDRVPPHSLDAERGVLGCLLLSPREGLGACYERFSPSDEFLYDPRHQVIFSNLVEMCEAQKIVDLVTLVARLEDKGVLETIGGFAYLSSLMDAVPSAANLPYYLETVREKYLLRRLIRTCTGLIGDAYEESSDVGLFLDRAEAEVLSVNQKTGASKDIHDLVGRTVSRIEYFFHNKGKLSGLETGFWELDKKTNGLQPGEMIVIAARPSMGKTSLAMNIAEHVAIKMGEPVGVFSLEMTAEALVMRLLCSQARLNQHKLRDGSMEDHDFARIADAADRLAAAKLHIDDTAGLDILQLRARARRMKDRHGIKLFVIDYLQLVQSSTQRRGDSNRAQEIGEISSGVKSLAKELDVPVIVLSQLNRDLERDKTRKPRLSDLRESGAIEQDADVVGLLYRANPKNPREPSSGEDDDEATANSDVIPVNLLIAKQRNGPTGDVFLNFEKSYTRFESAPRVREEDIPHE